VAVVRYTSTHKQYTEQHNKYTEQHNDIAYLTLIVLMWRIG